MHKSSTMVGLDYHHSSMDCNLEPEMDLLTLQKTLKLTDEEVVIKFFKNINARPYNKDNYIRDFEDFYF